MNEPANLQRDPRTGCPSAIHNDTVSDGIRSSCTTLNRHRTRGILAATAGDAPWEPAPVDVWTTAFVRGIGEHGIPLVNLEQFGIFHDHDGFISSDEDLIALPSGAEAQPFLDRKNAVVYKLFDLQVNGSIGKMLALRFVDDRFEIDVAPATWLDTLDKLSVLNAGGGLPTEIVGLADSFDYLLAKQPLAQEQKDFHADREVAEALMCGIYPVGQGLRQRLIVSEVFGEPWLIGDLHERNIMRDSAGVPTIIDALVGKITPQDRARLNWLDLACEHARVFRKTGERPVDRFMDVNDDDL